MADTALFQGIFLGHSSADFDEGVVNLGVTMGLGKEERGQCPNPRNPIPPKAGDTPLVT